MCGFNLIGVLVTLPRSYSFYSYAFSGWGLSDGKNGYISHSGYKVCDSLMGYQTGDIVLFFILTYSILYASQVSMRVDVQHGGLKYAINGSKCAEIRDVADIKEGVYVAVQMCGAGTEWTIISGKLILGG
jgi:hypothetical protein